MYKTPQVESTMGIFKTLVRFRIVDPINHPGEWAIWYGKVKMFAFRYEGRDGK
jgi:hypothetical protein